MRIKYLCLPLVVLIMSSCGVREIDLSPPAALRLAVTAPDGHPLVEAMRDFSRLCAERSHGTLTVTVIPAGRWGEDALVLARLKRGELDLACVGSPSLASLSPYYEAFSLPLAFRDTNQFYRVLDGEIGTRALQSLESRGLIGLSHVEPGALYFISRSGPLNSPADFQDKKCATLPGPGGNAFMRVLGAHAINLPWDAGFPALRSGLVDVAAVDLFPIAGSPGPSADYSLLRLAVIHSPAVLLAGPALLERLPPAAREFLVATGNDAARTSRDMATHFENAAFLALPTRGIQLTEPTPGAFEAKAAAAADQLDKDPASILESIQKQ